MKQDEKIARLRLIRSNNIGPVTSFLLISRYGSAVEAIRALPELTKRSRNRAKLAPLKSVEKEMREVEKMGGQIIIRGEEGYPNAFTAYDDAPAVITVRGHTSLLHKPLLAIVGSRNASVNACNFASRLAAVEDKGQCRSGFVAGPQYICRADVTAADLTQITKTEQPGDNKTKGD